MEDPAIKMLADETHTYNALVETAKAFHTISGLAGCKSPKEEIVAAALVVKTSADKLTDYFVSIPVQALASQMTLIANEYNPEVQVRYDAVNDLGLACSILIETSILDTVTANIASINIDIAA